MPTHASAHPPPMLSCSARCPPLSHPRRSSCTARWATKHLRILRCVALREGAARCGVLGCAVGALRRCVHRRSAVLRAARPQLHPRRSSSSKRWARNTFAYFGASRCMRAQRASACWAALWTRSVAVSAADAQLFCAPPPTVTPQAQLKLEAVGSQHLRILRCVALWVGVVC